MNYAVLFVALMAGGADPPSPVLMKNTDLSDEAYDAVTR